MGVSDRLFALEGRWLMGKLIPHELLGGIEKHLRVVAPGRERELVESIGARAKELTREDADLAVDGAAKGMLAMAAVVLAAYETLRPELEDDGARTILFLQHVFGEVLKRSMEVAVSRARHRRSTRPLRRRARAPLRPIGGPRRHGPPCDPGEPCGLPRMYGRAASGSV